MSVRNTVGDAHLFSPDTLFPPEITDLEVIIQLLLTPSSSPETAVLPWVTVVVVSPAAALVAAHSKHQLGKEYLALRYSPDKVERSKRSFERRPAHAMKTSADVSGTVHTYLLNMEIALSSYIGEIPRVRTAPIIECACRSWKT